MKHFRVVIVVFPLIITLSILSVLAGFVWAQEEELRTGNAGDALTAETSALLIPGSGPFGTNITISGGVLSGAAGGTAALVVNDVDTSVVLTLNSASNIIPDTITITDTYFNVGLNEIKAVVIGQGLETSPCLYEVTEPTFSIDLITGTVGTVVTCTGSGWPTRGPNFVCVSIDDGSGYLAYDVVEPELDGTISSQISIPFNWRTYNCYHDVEILFKAWDMK